MTPNTLRQSIPTNPKESQFFRQSLSQLVKESLNSDGHQFIQY